MTDIFAIWKRKQLLKRHKLTLAGSPLKLNRKNISNPERYFPWQLL